MKLRRLDRGLTFLEVMVASALLAVVMLAVLSVAATEQTVITESTDQVIATNSAHNALESLLQADWQTQLLPYYNNYLNGQTDFFAVPIPGEDPPAARDPFNPQLPSNKLGTFVVREPDNTRFPGEFPGYNRGAPHIRFGPRLGAIPMPPNPRAPTCLLLIVRVDTTPRSPTPPYAPLPPKPGRGTVVVELRSLRSFL